MLRVRTAARRLVVLMVICIGAASSPHAADEEARVLILNGTDPYLPAYLAIDSAMRSTLASETGRRISFFSESLDAQRFPVQPLEPEYVALLSDKYRTLRIDVVVAVSLPALEFFKQHGEQLWPGARLVFHGFPGEAIPTTDLPPYASGIATNQDVSRTIALARHMQPNAPRMVVITGSSDIDRRVEQLAQTALAVGTGPMQVQYLSGLPLGELVARVAAEPADSIIVFASQFRDRDGRPYTPREVLRAISKTSLAPVYGVAETYFGFGAAAGIVESYAARGRLVAEQVRVALTGTQPEAGAAMRETPSRCVADARALRRWSLDERRLPGGCEILFADPSLWRQYGWAIVLALAVIAGQAMLIGTLFVQRRQRRIAESESQKRYAEMAHMNRRVALGEVSASIAHELNQPLGAIRNNAAAAELLIKADPPRLGEVAEILADIKRDDQRASDIIARIRKMLSKTEFEIVDIDLNDAIGETVNLLAQEAADKGLTLKTELDAGLPRVSADRVQVQQVLMNLALNAMEAVHHRPAVQQVVMIRSRRATDKEAEVSVADSGAGIPAEMLPHIFDAFATSKPAGMGLGLAISRTIVEAHGGHIRAENAPAGGAIVHFTLPLAATRHA